MIKTTAPLVLAAALAACTSQGPLKPQPKPAPARPVTLSPAPSGQARSNAPPLASPPSAAPAIAAIPLAPNEDAQDVDRLMEADDLLRRKQPAQAIALLDRMIARYEESYSAEDGRIYSASTPMEARHYGALLEKDRSAGVILGPAWSSALFLKGYALLDLQRPDDAREAFEDAAELAPANSQFRAELGKVYLLAQDWQAALEEYAQAERAARFSKPTQQAAHRARAQRGRGEALTKMRHATASADGGRPVRP